MIEAKDLEAIQKICVELETMGYTKPKVTLSDATSEQSNINLSFWKRISRNQSETTGEK
jgi:hypothetical protein